MDSGHEREKEREGLPVIVELWALWFGIKSGGEE